MPAISRYSDADLEAAVKASSSIAGVMRLLGIRLAGGSHAHISRRIKRLGLDTSHFLGQASNRGRPARNRLRPIDVLVVHPEGSSRVKPHLLRRVMAEAGRAFLCAACGMGREWMGRPIQLHVDHINGNFLDCRLSNLRFLCPNCHSQTANFAGRARWGVAPTQPDLFDGTHGI
jgi:hypothetical protein